MKKTYDYKQAHAHSSNHRDEIEKSKVCGCFYCLGIFLSTDITDWIDDLSDKNALENTALCPKCGIDAVLGDKSGYPIDNNFLEAMRKKWF